MIDLNKYEQKLARYNALKAQLSALRISVRNIEFQCRDAIAGQWALCRMTKHGEVVDQVKEILGDTRTPDYIKIPLNQLYPLLTKAIEDLRKTNSQATKLWHELSASADSLLGQIISEISSVQNQMFSRLTAILRPFTNEHNACALARDTDAYKALEFHSTNLMNTSDPQSNLNIIKSAIDTAKRYRELLK